MPEKNCASTPVLITCVRRRKQLDASMYFSELLALGSLPKAPDTARRRETFRSPQQTTLQPRLPKNSRKLPTRLSIEQILRGEFESWAKSWGEGFRAL